MNEASRNAHARHSDAHAHAPHSHLLREYRDLQLRQARTNAAVNSIAKREMAPRVWTVDAKSVCIRTKGGFIAICREVNIASRMTSSSPVCRRRPLVSRCISEGEKAGATVRRWTVWMGGSQTSTCVDLLARGSIC
jgi:hypothetical protein